MRLKRNSAYSNSAYFVVPPCLPAKFLHEIGLRAHPPLEHLLHLAATDDLARDAALTYFCQIYEVGSVFSLLCLQPVCTSAYWLCPIIQCISGCRVSEI